MIWARKVLTGTVSAAGILILLGVFAAICMTVSCGDRPPGKARIPKSALVPRKSVTLRVTGDTIFTSVQQDTLLSIARNSIASYLRNGITPERPSVSDSALVKERGCLVKLMRDTIVRGTSGYILPIKGFAAALSELSMRAATGGRRFEPLKPRELDKTLIQITAVSIPVTVSDISEIKLGRHGLVLLSAGTVAGILLVDDVMQSGTAGAAVERLLSLGRMSKNDWPSELAVIQAFTEHVFEEGQ